MRGNTKRRKRREPHATPNPLSQPRNSRKCKANIKIYVRVVARLDEAPVRQIPKPPQLVIPLPSDVSPDMRQRERHNLCALVPLVRVESAQSGRRVEALDGADEVVLAGGEGVCPATLFPVGCEDLDWEMAVSGAGGCVRGRKV